MASVEPSRKDHGIRIVRAGELHTNMLPTPGMTRVAAITRASAGAKKLWAGIVVVEPNVKRNPHHQGELDTALYIVKGPARSMGCPLEVCRRGWTGRFHLRAPFVVHQEINALPDARPRPLSWEVARNL